jgi:hypothetical protein
MLKYDQKNVVSIMSVFVLFIWGNKSMGSIFSLLSTINLKNTSVTLRYLWGQNTYA